MVDGLDAVLWTVWVALACYVASLWTRLRWANRSWARAFWSVGFFVLLLHMVAAFQFVHHWSHTAAYVETARRTLAMTGLESGGGLFANYAFALIWGVDCISWWRWPRWYEHRSLWVEWPIQAFLAFIAFNATVVFGTGGVRWAGVAATLVLGWALIRRASRAA